jgi:hypothetical protein
MAIVETVESGSDDALEALTRETLAHLALIQLLLDLVQKRLEQSDLLPETPTARRAAKTLAGG